MAAFASVDEYLEAQPAKARKALEKVRHAVQEGVPDGQDVISYGIPCRKTTGFVCYYAAFTEHWSFSSPPSGLHKAFAKELAGRKVSKSAIQFPYDDPVPVDLVKRMAAFRAAEVAAATSAKARGR